METLKVLIPIALILTALIVLALPKMKIVGKTIIITILALLFVMTKYVWPGHNYRFSGNTVATTTEGTITPSSVKTDGNYLTLAGSNTIGDMLAVSLVSEYLRKNGASDVNVSSSDKDEKEVTATLNNEKIHIAILAHGTSTGFSALSENKADICMASMPSTNGALNEHVIGMDGITLIVNSNNSIHDLSLDDIKRIFTGEITNWNQIGGNNTPITLYRMDNNSGTYKMFNEIALKNQNISSSAKAFEKSEDIVQNVSKDPGAIGFISYSFINSSVKALSIKSSSDLPAIRPNSLSIQTEKYPLCRRLYLYTGSSSNNNNVAPFITFVESQIGQDVVEKSGFVNLSINNDKVQDLSGDPEDYKKLIHSGATKLSMELRFKFGSTDLVLDSRANADIDRLVDYISKNKGKQVVLCGFTDNIGGQAANIPLSQKRAQFISGKLGEQGITVKEIYGFGSVRPTNGNLTDEEKAANRRVEVWVK